MMNINNTKKIFDFFLFLIPIIFLSSFAISTIACSIYCLIIFLILKQKKIKIKIDILDKILFIFFILIITSSLQENILNQTFKSKENIIKLTKDVALIRFFFIYLLIKNIFNYDLVNAKNFFKWCFFASIFLSLNIFLMHLIGYDLFLNTINLHGRYSSVFGDRSIAGSYILNFFFFALIFFNFIKKKIIIFFESFFVFLIGLAILLTLDRSPFILYILSIVLIGILSLKKKPPFFLSVIISILIYLIVIINYDKVWQRYRGLVYQEFDNYKIITPKVFSSSAPTSIEYYSYGSILRDTYDILLFEKLIFGSGSKSFYERCKKYKLNSSNELWQEYGIAAACPPHAHNLYGEIIISGGLIGLLFFLTFIILKILNLLKKIIFIKNKNIYYNICLILFISLIIELIPLRSYGNVFNTYNGFFLFFKLSIIFALITKIHKFNKI